MFEIKISDIHSFKRKALIWAQKFNYVCWLNSNECKHLPPSYLDCLAVANNKIELDNHKVLDSLNHSIKNTQDWHFGFFAYDLKNEIHELKSENPDLLAQPESTFFIADHLLIFGSDLVTVKSKNLEIIEEIENVYIADNQNYSEITLINAPTKDEYLKEVDSLLKQINSGNIYEINYAIQYVFEYQQIEPLNLFEKLSAYSPNPFESLLKINNFYVLCASPERFLRKSGANLISQPIKGTVARGIDASADEKQRQYLQNSAKEQCENVMIVDLVRNDLSMISKAGSVKVEELFGVYTLPQVHQMISTISSKLVEGKEFKEIIASTFPMGSMTGAPKISAMQLAEKHEYFKRGVYSGAIGYINPEGDFDFNVVIRSIFMNADTKRLGFAVGSAITAQCNPEEEYEECLLKAKAIQKVLGQHGIKMSSL